MVRDLDVNTVDLSRGHLAL